MDNAQLVKWALIRNSVTVVATVVCVLGLFWMSHSWHSLWSLLLMFSTSTIEVSSKNSTKPKE